MLSTLPHSRLAEPIMGRLGRGGQIITLRSCSIRTATTSRRSSEATNNEALGRPAALVTFRTLRRGYQIEIRATPGSFQKARYVKCRRRRGKFWRLRRHDLLAQYSRLLWITRCKTRNATIIYLWYSRASSYLPTNLGTISILLLSRSDYS